MKTVIVACGSGIATSTILSNAIDELLMSADIDHDIIQCSIQEIDSYESMGDLIVSSTSLSKNFSIPAVNGMGFITGIGEEEAREQILKYLKG